MSITTVTSGEFARDVAQAQRAAAAGPVFVTNQGKPAFALLKIDDHYNLAGNKARSLLDIMDSIPGGDFEFDPPKLDIMGCNRRNWNSVPARYKRSLGVTAGQDQALFGSSPLGSTNAWKSTLSFGG